MESKNNSHTIELPSPQAKALHSYAAEQNTVAESWEDDDISDDDPGVQTPTDGPEGTGQGLDPALRPPPPTPMSPRSEAGYMDWLPATQLGGGRPQTYDATRSPTQRPDSESDHKRPETTTATANRRIAASLGLKAPKKTEEQLKYDRALKEQEIKRRNKEKEQRRREQEEDEKAKAAVWES